MTRKEAMEILGWDGTGDLKRCYRSAAMRAHPDRGGTNELMAKLGEAYEILSKPVDAPNPTVDEAKARFARAWGNLYKQDFTVTEKDFQSALIKLLREDTGADTFNVHGSAMQTPGWPDVQVYHPKWTGHLELKVGAKPTQKQQNRIKRLQKRGTAAFFLQLEGKDLVLRGIDFEELFRTQYVKDGMAIMNWLVDCTKAEARRQGRMLWRYDGND